ncbi:hypothetical protein ACYSNM_01940 [Myroides sp. LJL116]
MIHSKYFYVTFLLFTTVVFGQDFLDKVTPLELSQNQSEVFLQTPIEILQEHQEIYFAFSNVDAEFKVVEQISRKIKVYDSKAASRANLKVDYFQNNYVQEQVELLSAYIYTLDKTKVVKTKVPSSWMISSESKSSFKYTGIDFSKVPSGSIIEYSYAKMSNYLDNLPVWEIQGNLPKIISTYTSRVPNYYNYEIIESGSVKILKEQAQVMSDFSSSRMFLSQTKVPSLQTNMMAQNIGEIQNEPFVDNLQNYLAYVKQDLVWVAYPLSPKQVVLPSKKEFLESLYKSRSFYGQIKNQSYYKKSIDKLVYMELEPKARAQKILEFVQSKVKWNRNYSIYPEFGVKTAFNKSLGNSADINLMLISMLEYVDLKVTPLLLSTVQNGRKTTWQSNYYNNVIAALQIGEDYYFLDASSPLSTLGILPLEDLNGQAISVAENASSLHFNLTPGFLSSSSLAYQIELLNNGAIKGSMLANYNGYDQIKVGSIFQDGGKFGFVSEFQAKNGGIRLSNLTTSNMYSLENTLRLTANIYKENASVFFNNKWFVNVFDWFEFRVNPFTANTRLGDIYFGFASKQSYMVGVSIPQGYKLESLPKDFTIQDVSIGLGVQVKFSAQANKVEAHLNLTRAQANISVEHYPKVKAFFEELENKLQDYIIFTPVQ